MKYSVIRSSLLIVLATLVPTKIYSQVNTFRATEVSTSKFQDGVWSEWTENVASDNLIIFDYDKSRWILLLNERTLNLDIVGWENESNDQDGKVRMSYTCKSESGGEWLVEYIDHKDDFKQLYFTTPSIVVGELDCWVFTVVLMD